MSLKKYFEATQIKYTSASKFKNAVIKELENLKYTVVDAGKKVGFKTADQKAVLATMNNIAPFKISGIYNDKIEGLSSAYTTYEFELTKDSEVNGMMFQKGTSVKFANNSENASSGDDATKYLNNSDLKPDKLKLDGKEHKGINALINAVHSGISSLDKKIQKVIIDLIANITESTEITKVKPQASGIIKITDGDHDSIKYTKEVYKAFDTLLSPQDVKIIGKNFGEVLGAIYMFKKYSPKTVEFPSAGNAPLTDFVIDGVVSVSSKFQAGAAPGFKSIAEKAKDAKKMGVKINKDLQYIVDQVISGDSILGVFLSLIDYFDTNIFKELSKLKIALNADSFRDDVNNFMLAYAEEYSVKELYQYLKSNIWAHTNEPAIDTAGLDKLIKAKSKTLYGYILYPAESELVKEINSRDDVMKSLKELANTLDVKQLYLDFKLQKKVQMIEFKIKEFKTNKFSFALTNSANAPLSSHISIKMK